MSNAYAPCLPTRVKVPPSGELWIHEIKYEGFRILARRDGDGIKLLTRQRADYTSRYSLIVSALRKLRVKSICIDGEAVCFTGALQDFEKLWNRTHDQSAKLCAFDLLELNGEDLRTRPLGDRKKLLL